jgi:hypothetical protein
MPCAKAMRGCAASCLHRASVNAYRDSRDAWEAARESDAPAWDAAGAANSGAAAHQLDDAAFREAYPAPTFKAWLIGQAGERRHVEAERESWAS